MIQALGRTEQMAGGARIHEQVLIGGIAHGSPHGGQAADELRDGKFELADQHTARSRDGKARCGPSRPPATGRGWRPAAICRPWALRPRTGCPAGATVRVPPGRAARWAAAAPEAEPATAPWAGDFLAAAPLIAAPRVVASSRIASSTTAALREAARRRAVRASLLTLRENAFGGLIEGLAGGVVKQRLGDAGGFELMGEIGVEFLAREPFQVILHGDALAQGFVHLQREGAAQQGLAHQQQSQVVGGIHVEVQQQRELFEGGMAQQLGFVADENGMLLLALIETHDGFGDLAHQVAAVVRRFQIQFQGQLAEQIQSRSGGPVQIQDLIEVGIEPGGEGAGGGGFAGADFAGEQTGAVMIDQKLEPRLDLGPGLRSEQLLGIGAVAEGSFLETEESLHHGTSPPPRPFVVGAVRRS